MDSINKNQSEENHKDLTGEEGLKKMKELVQKASTCFFCTNIKTNKSFSARPMSVQKIDEQGNAWFLSASDSKKNAEVFDDPAVQLLFKGSDYSDFLTVYGTASVSHDEKMIHELWNPILKTWFTEGKNDPRITLIKVAPLQAYYWDTKHVQVVGLIKRLVGAAISKTMDDSIEGKIKV